MDPFADPKAVAHYVERPPRIIPGHEGLLRMASLLLAESVPDTGRVLVVGAGGGLETKVFADTHPGWRFDGVDPSAQMLALATTVIGSHLDRVSLHLGTIDAAPDGPFDGATCLLTLHFLPERVRRETLAAIHQRLRKGARFVIAHLSFPQDAGARDLWLSRYLAFMASSGMASSDGAAARAAVDEKLTILTPEQEEAMLREAGFNDVGLFYTGFAFRGWVGSA